MGPLGTDFIGNLSPTSQSDSGISRSETAETLSTGPSQHAIDSKYNERLSVSESNLPSPDGLDPSDYTFSCSSAEERSPSPESHASFDEFTALTPDSQIPMFDNQLFEYIDSMDSRSVSLKIDTSSLLDVFNEDRPDSPESLVFDFPESYSDIPSDDAQSFVDHWLFELKPSDPQVAESVGNFIEDITEETHNLYNRVKQKTDRTGLMGCM